MCEDVRLWIIVAHASTVLRSKRQDDLYAKQHYDYLTVPIPISSPTILSLAVVLNALQ